MKTRTLLLACLVALPLLPAAHAQALPPEVTVTLRIDASAYPVLPTYETKTCVVSVPEGSDGKAMLTAATLAGCIAGWGATYSPTVGALYLDTLDGRRAFCDAPLWIVHCTFWSLSVNGALSSTGIDGWAAAQGDEYGFAYDRSFAGLPIP